MTISLGSRNFQVFVRDQPGATPIWSREITNGIVDLTLTCNQLDTQTPDGLLSVSGSMTVADIVGATYSIDPRETSGSPSAAQIWARGNYVQIFVADTTGFLRELPTELYIRTVPSPPNLPENTITVELTDKLGLQDYPDAEGDESGITLGSSTDRKTIIDSLAAAASLPSVASGDSLTAYPLSVPVPKGDTRSYARFMGQCVATAGALVWQDNSGDLRITAINLSPASAAFSIALGHGEAEFDFVNNDERPPELLTITGSGVNTNTNSYPRTTETNILGTKEGIREGGGVDEIVVYRERVREELSGNTLTRTTTIFMPRVAINPNSSAFLYSLRVASKRVERQIYRADNSALVRRTISEDRAKGYINQTNLNKSEEFTSDLSDLISYEDCTETFDYHPTQGFLRRRELRIDRVRAYFGAGFSNPTDLVPVQDDREEWTKKSGKEWQRELSCRRCAQEVYSENVGTLSPFALVIDSDASLNEQSDTGSTDPPPAQLLPDTVNQESTVYEGSAEFLPIGGSAPVPKSQTIQMQGLFFVSNEQCQFLANLVGRIRQGRALGARMTIAIPDWFLTNYSPYSAVDITYNSITTRYLIDGWSLSLDGQEAVFSCGLLELGTVASGIVTPRFDAITQQIIESGSVIAVDQVLPPEEANLLGGSVAGGVLTTNVDLSQTADLIGGAVAGGVLQSGFLIQADLVGGAVAGGALTTEVFIGANLFGGGVAGGVSETVLTQVADLIGGAVAGGVLGAGSSGSTLLTGLLAWHDFEESSGNLLDSTDNNYDFVPTGSFTYSVASTGNLGNSIRQPGGNPNSNFLTLDNNTLRSALTGDNTFYIATWIRIDAQQNVVASNIINYVDNESAFQIYYAATGDDLRFSVSDNGVFASLVNVFHPTFNYATNGGQWTLIEVYHDADNDEIGIAINNGAFTTVAHSAGVYTPTLAESQLTIGRYTASFTGGNPNWRITQHVIWDRILNTAERNELWNSGSGIQYSSL